MIFRQSLSTIATITVVSLLVIALIGAAPVTVTAQEGDDVDVEPDDVLDDETDDEPTEIEDQIGDLQIHSYEFVDTDDRGWVVAITATWTGDSPEQVTVMQAVDPDEQRDRLGITNVRLAPDDETTITVDLSAEDPVTVVTQQSIESGNVLPLYPGEPSETVTLTQGVAIGIVTMAIGTVGMAWRKTRVHDDIDEGWD